MRKLGSFLQCTVAKLSESGQVPREILLVTEQGFDIIASVHWAPFNHCIVLPPEY